ncbi:MAG: DNA mismatch repair endonuclease MutL [Xenococcaceae cyanobacterium MO_188.B29]|nr:DNA mismatch repair endonuclease MutL [Xenococcaceae cyanobacterium MO_188.B29]
MSPLIRTLSPETIALIAAGEVIDSLAAVVRELVENALDAGATRITVSLIPELWWVQVTDNGKGMSLEDLEICASPHSTSKISDRQDLWQIKSLGFRGEALHSIAQVADLEILSRPRIPTDEIGWRVIYLSGKVITKEVVAIAPGTIVTVANLFGRMPVRRRGLPILPQQLKSVQSVIQNLALCHPQVTWQVKQNQKLWFQISPGINSQKILPQILPRVNVGDLQYLKLDLDTHDTEECTDTESSDIDTKKAQNLPSTQLELIIGLPDRCHRHRADWVKVAVNGRIVHLPELEQTMIKGMARTLPRDRYPLCFLHLHTASTQVDWNRHPAKSEIYLHSLTYWQEQVDRAIEQILRLNIETLPAAVGDRRIGKLLKVAEEQGKYQLEGDSSSEQKSSNEVGLIQLKAVAQVNKTYIVAEHTSGLWLVEQHIAHERILYEQLQDDWQLISLETPLILNNLTSTQLEQLQRLDIEIEPFGEGLWAARNAPAMLAEREDCIDALMELSYGGDLQSAQVATACRSAIRNGTPLELPQMQNLLDRWKITRNPRTCPHGRPIYLSLEESALARFFRRHWVIGKSHGI